MRDLFVIVKFLVLNAIVISYFMSVVFVSISVIILFELSKSTYLYCFITIYEQINVCPLVSH